MVRFLLLLTLLLLSPIRNSYAQYNACYCTTPWIPNSIYGNSCTANPDCWACAPGAYPQSWQQAFCSNYQPPQIITCNQETQFQSQSCPVNQSGIITQSRQKICPSGVWTEWQTVSNTCTPNPPTCQVSSQQQTLQCQTGYTGSIIQTRSSTCPNPYGSPQWQPWVTTSDTCKKSINNPTNPTSPISPISPVNTATTSATMPAVNSAPVSTPQTMSMETSVAPTADASATSGTAPTTSALETKTGSQTTSTTQASPTPAPKGKTQSAVGLALSLELFAKPGLQQANVFPEVSIVQGIPNDVIFSGQLLVDVYGYSMPDQSGLFNKMAAEAVELEQ